MAQHNNLHRNQRTSDQAAASAAEGGRSSSGFTTAEGVAGYVEGAFGEDLKNSQVGKRKSGISPGGESSLTSYGETSRVDREQDTAKEMTESLGRAAAPPSETWSDPGRGTGELGAEQADPKGLPDAAAGGRATSDH